VFLTSKVIVTSPTIIVVFYNIYIQRSLATLFPLNKNLELYNIDYGITIAAGSNENKIPP